MGTFATGSPPNVEMKPTPTPLLAFVSLMALVWMPSCGKEPTSDAQPPKAATTAVEQESGRAHPSVLGFTPSFELTEETNGVRFVSESLIGKPWVVDLSRSPQVRISVDMESLKAGVEDDQSWTTLTGTQDLSQRLKRAGNVSSNATLMLVDAYQRVRGVYELAAPRMKNALVTDIAALEAEIVNIPEDVQDPAWMKAREQAQVATADSIRASMISVSRISAKPAGFASCTRLSTIPGNNSRAFTTTMDPAWQSLTWMVMIVSTSTL